MIINQHTIKVKNTDQQYSYPAAAIVITDKLLRFINDVFIFSTQTETEYRGNQYVLDAINGTLTIPGAPLGDNEHLTITIL